MRQHALLWLLLAAYLVMATLFAIVTPDWQAPDEPAHANYVRQLAGGALPLMEPGDWDQQYLETIVSSRFDPALPITPITYEDWQPPLYYLLQTPVYRLTDGSLTAMRLLSVLLGAGVVVLTYFIGLALFPDRAWLALSAAAFVAFLPQHLAMLGSVNNDSLAELIIAGLLLLMVVPWRPERTVAYLIGLGLLLGAGLLTKATVYIMAPVVAVFLLWRYWGRWRELVTAGLLVFGPALLLGLLWWGRNAVVYGDFDVLARETHNEVVVGQPRTDEWVAQYGPAETVRRFLATTFNSFWGQFGWMAAPLPRWAYSGLTLLSVAAVAGLGVALARRSRTPPAERMPALSLAVLGTTLILTTGVHVGYNLTFVQHQGRYLFPALVPIALGVSVGLETWLRPLIRRHPWTAYLLPLGLALGLAALAIFSLFRIIVPALSPP